MSEEPRWIERVLGTAMLALVPALFLVSAPFFSTFQVPKLVLAGLVLAVWALYLGFAKELAWDRTDLLALVPLVGSAPAFFYVQVPWDAWQQVCLGLAGSVAFWGARRAAFWGSWRVTLQGVVVGSVVVVACVYVFETVFPDSFGFSAVRGGASLGNPGLVGEACGYATVLAVGLAAASWEHWRSRPVLACLWVAAAVFCSVVALVSRSTTGLAAVGAGLFVMFVVWLWRSRGLATSLLVLGLVPAGLVVLFVLIGVPEALERRFYVYEIGMQAVWNAPLLGTGPGGFAKAFLDAQADHLVANPSMIRWWTDARNAHCVFLQFWAEQGLSGLIGVAVLLLGGVWAVVRRSAKLDAAGTGAYVAALVTYAGSVSFESAAMRIVGLMWLGAMLVVTVRGRSQSEDPIGAVRGRRLSFGLCRGVSGLAVFGALLIIPIWLAAADYAFVDGRPLKALQLLPSHGRALFAVGLAEAASGNHDEGCGHLEKALKYHPNLAVAIGLGNCRFRQGRYDQAEVAFRQAVVWKRTYAPGWANLALVYAQTDSDKARRHLVRAMSLRPGDKSIRRLAAEVERTLARREQPSVEQGQGSGP